MHRLTSIARILLGIAFPEHCSGCKRSGVALCQQCRAGLALAPPVPHQWLGAAFSYRNRIVRTILTDLKFRHKRGAAISLCEMAADSLLDFLDEKMVADERTPLILVPIPANKKRSIDRGFNQAAFLAKLFARQLPNARVKTLLQRSRVTRQQSSIKNRTARLKNMDGAFTAHATELPKNALVVLVDDIITTGATMSAARAAFKAAGCKKVYGFAVAYTPLWN